MQKVNKNAAKSPQFRTPQRNLGHVCGQIEPSSREGYRYVINFIDEYSSMLFTYFMHTKDEASQALKSFLADITPYGQIKEVHSDNGTEYTNKFFQTNPE